MSLVLSRRQALQTLGLSGIAVSFLGGCSAIPVIPKRPMPTSVDALGWILLRADGQFELRSPRMEMGQQVLSALRRVAGLELGVDPLAVVVTLPRTNQVARFKATVGSDSISEVCEPLALACAALREEVFRRATQKLGERRGWVITAGTVGAGGVSMALKDLAEPAIQLSAPDPATLELRYRKRVKGEAARPQFGAAATDRLETAVLQGKAMYAADVQIPGMLYAAVLHPDYSDQAEQTTPLLSIDEAAVRAVPGFHSIVRPAGLCGPALVATRMGALLRMKQLARPVWARPVAPVLSASEGEGPNSGAVRTGGENRRDLVDVRLNVPMAAHAAMEPRCAIAHFDSAHTLKVWCGTQDPFFVRDVLARDTGLALDAITVQPMRMGGAFGARTIAAVEREAAAVAKAVNAPVKLQWFRDDEFTAGFHRPPSIHRIEAHVSGGALLSWRHALSTSHVLFTNAALPPWLQRIAEVAGDKGSVRGQTPPYRLQGSKPQLEVKLNRLAVLTGPWRGLGAGPNALAMEVAMDRAAFLAGADPIAFRLLHLETAPPAQCRLAQSLLELRDAIENVASAQNVATSKAIETEASAIRASSSMGVGCGIYKDASYAAAAAWATIEVDASHVVRRIRIHRLACTHDCGWIIDADSVRAQIQGNLIWCLGMVLHESLSLNDAGVADRNFDTYTVPRMSDVPPMEIRLIASDKPPSGAGETAMVAGGGAIANAVLRALDQLGYAPKHLQLPLKAGWQLSPPGAQA